MEVAQARVASAVDNARTVRDRLIDQILATVTSAGEATGSTHRGPRGSLSRQLGGGRRTLREHRCREDQCATEAEGGFHRWAMEQVIAD